MVKLIKVVKMQTNRSELRKQCMTILYQIEVYDTNNIPYTVDDVIKEVSVIDNEFVKDVVYGVITYKESKNPPPQSYIQKIEGDYYNVVGLDMGLLTQMLKRF